jgi:menaquinone-dependent protoporphyrinogen oxidase
MKQTLTRRSFLKSSGIVLGAGLATCCGLTTLAAQSPEIPLTESHYGDPQMSSKILVAYATRCGSTAEIAQAIAKTISQNEASVDVLPVKNIPDADALRKYQAVVVGSAIRMGKWLPEASDFVEKYQDVLSKIPLAYFTACLTLTTDTPETRQRAAAFLEPVHAIIQPQAEAFFAGKFDPGRLSLVMRLMSQVKGMPEGDFRNWETIESWAATCL